jgi:hypothetical protein
MPSPSSSLELDSGTTLDEEAVDTTDEDDFGADSEEAATTSEELDPSAGSVSLNVSEEISATEELVPSAGSLRPCSVLAGTLVVSEELEANELSLDGASAALVDDESSPQATMPAPTRALKQKTRAIFLI